MVFVIWSAFFDQNDWFSIRDKKKELEGVRNNIKYMNVEIARMEAEKKTLTDSTQLKDIETYAREKYRMHKENEDVYVIENAPK